MLRALGSVFAKFAKKYLPDALIFAMILTIITLILGMVIQKESFVNMVKYMGDGFWNLLSFAMQMTLIVVTGYILATTKPIKAFLSWIARFGNSPFKAVALVTFVMAIFSWFQWGLGLIVGALLAVEIARNQKGIHYPLLVAASYSGFLVWHAGLSGSAPLLVATPGHFLEDTIGTIPVSKTIFSPWSLLTVITLIITLPLINAAMHPKKKEEVLEVDPALLKEEPKKKLTAEDKKNMVFAEKVENSPVLPIIVSLIGIVYIFYYFFVKKGGLNLNILNFIFLMIGILLHWTPRNFIEAAKEGGKNSWGIVIQFPFYAGIMGMMINSGLASTIANWFVGFATAKTLPFWSYISAGLVNVFVPSGGGQWAVQGPIMTEAAHKLGASVPNVVMGVAWGDAWTNMIQPFWAIPLLSVAKLDIRDIMGYTMMALIWAFIVTSFFIFVLA